MSHPLPPRCPASAAVRGCSEPARRRITLLFLGLVLFLATSLSIQAADTPVVLVLAGQSNMLGQGERAALTDAQRALPPNVELIVDAKDPAAAARTFGPELALAHELAAAFPQRRFRLLKFAIGTTSIRAWQPEWSAEDARVAGNESVGALYPRLLGFLRRHLRVGEPPPHAVLWFQGERDARFAATAVDYAPRLDQLIAGLRRDLGAPDSWFVLGIVNPPYEHVAPVQAAQRATPQRMPRVKVVESAGLTKRSDNLHYDTAAQLELGRRFARELIPTID